MDEERLSECSEHEVIRCKISPYESALKKRVMYSHDVSTSTRRGCYGEVHTGGEKLGGTTTGSVNMDIEYTCGSVMDGTRSGMRRKKNKAGVIRGREPGRVLGGNRYHPVNSHLSKSPNPSFLAYFWLSTKSPSLHRPSSLAPQNSNGCLASFTNILTYSSLAS